MSNPDDTATPAQSVDPPDERIEAAIAGWQNLSGWLAQCAAEGTPVAGRR
jgi:hypothetical protein